MIDLNEFYAQYCADRESTKFEMVQKAARETIELMAALADERKIAALDEWEIAEMCNE